MTEAQMKFLEERRRQQGKPSVSSLSTNPPVTNAADQSEGAAAAETIQDMDSAPKLANAQDVWRFTEGTGMLGKYTVGRHIQHGTVVELWHEGTGSFTFTRVSGSQPKYCSSYGSMQDEEKMFAPTAVAKLQEGKGTKWQSGSVDAGNWGCGEVRGKRLVYKSTVATRGGSETVELQLTKEGFIFLCAEQFKCVAVKGGELMQMERSEAVNMIKLTDAEIKAEADRESKKR